MGFNEDLRAVSLKTIAPHEHDFSEISGTARISSAEIISLTATKLTAGTIDASVITVTNINADNINTGTLNASVVAVTNINATNINTGTLDASIATITNLNATNISTGTLSVDRLAIDSITVDKLAAGTIGTHIIKLSNSASSRIESNDGTSLIIRGNGTIVATSATITGSITATSGSLSGLTVPGNLTMSGTGVYRTSSSGQRIEITSANSGQMDFYTGATLVKTEVEAFAETTAVTDYGGLEIRAGVDTGRNEGRFRVSSQSPDNDEFSFGTGGAAAAVYASGEAGQFDSMLVLAAGLATDSLKGMVVWQRNTSDTGIEIVTGTTLAGATTQSTFDADGTITIKGATVNGDINLQDGGVTEWIMKAHTNDNFQLLDDGSVVRLVFAQATGDFTIQDDAGNAVIDYDDAGNAINFHPNVGNLRAIIDASKADFDQGGQEFRLVLPVKTTTGDVGTPEEGAIVVNTFDNNVQVFADAAWRSLGSW